MSQDFFAGQGYGKVHVHYFTGSLDGDHVGRRQQAWIDTRRPRSTLPMGGKPRPTLGRGQVWIVKISGCPLLTRDDVEDMHPLFHANFYRCNVSFIASSPHRSHLQRRCQGLFILFTPIIENHVLFTSTLLPSELSAASVGLI